jgi:hypothetical protein
MSTTEATAKKGNPQIRIDVTLYERLQVAASERMRRTGVATTPKDVAEEMIRAGLEVAGAAPEASAPKARRVKR